MNVDVTEEISMEQPLNKEPMTINSAGEVNNSDDTAAAVVASTSIVASNDRLQRVMIGSGNFDQLVKERIKESGLFF